MAALAQETAELAARVAEECKSLRTLINANSPDLSSLNTSSTNNLVAAVNEVWTITQSGIEWDNIQSKPSTFTPSAHVHSWSDITSGVPTSFTPSAHKTSHATGGSDELTAADIGAAPTSHTHTASQISDSTSTGRSLMTAANAAAARTALELDNAAVNAAIAEDPAASKLALEINGVVVTKADGTRKGYAPSANTDTARGLALEAAFAAAVAGDTIDLSPGNYYVAKSTSSIAGITGQFAILDRMTVRLNGARLYKKATDTASAMFACNATSGIDDWSIIGPGVLEGSLYATSDTTARGTAAAEIGIEVRACRRARITDLSIINFAGTGIEANGATFAADEYTGGGSDKISTLHVHNCNIDRNNIGFANYAGNEYHLITNCTFNINNTALDIYAGNTKLVACDASKNTNHCIRIRNGGNDGHGTWTGGTISHNPGFAVSAEASMDNGFQFVGVHFYADSNSTNKIQSLGGGLGFIGCHIDSPFYASGTPTGMNTVANCFIAGSLAVVTDLSAAERRMWMFLDNYTLTGTWANNDDRIYVFADDAAAATGGLVAGRRYSTSTGELRIKL